MSEQSTNPIENEKSINTLQRAIASMQEETVPDGPPPELVSATLNSLWYPFRSPEVRDICRHMTADEFRRLKAQGKILPFVGGIVLYLVLWMLMTKCESWISFYLPRNWSLGISFLILIPFAFLIGWILFGRYRKKQIKMLCETEYATQKGFTPENLPLYLSFAKYKELYVFSIGLFVFVIASFALFFGWMMPSSGDFASHRIMNQMASVYANCKSYRDSGVVATRYIYGKDDDRNFTTERPFTTAFVRSDRLRFEFWEKDGDKQKNRRIIWCDRMDAKSWWKFWAKGDNVMVWWYAKPEVEKQESLELALCVANTISGEDIPQLLLPSEVWFQNLMIIQKTKHIEDGTLDGLQCYRVEGLRGDGHITLWIDKNSYLLRRVDKQYNVNPTDGKSFRVEETTTYDPIINRKFPDKLLEFDPPIPK
ncbi:MAG: hypothetical protein ABSA26_16000 [Thermoguttaceae bacterium]|jgi:outer membrane lipoprotein-sorting protein